MYTDESNVKEQVAAAFVVHEDNIKNYKCKPRLERQFIGLPSKSIGDQTSLKTAQ